MLNVVVVDDEEKIRTGIEKMITKINDGYTVQGTYENGQALLEDMERLEVDVVLTDIKMPKMDGLALAKELNHRYPQTQCVIITGFGEFDYAQKGMRYGVKDYLLKPIKKGELQQTLQRMEAETSRERQHHAVLVENTLLSVFQGSEPERVQAILNRSELAGADYYAVIQMKSPGTMDTVRSILRTTFHESDVKALALTSLYPQNITGVIALQGSLKEANDTLRNRVFQLQSAFRSHHLSVIGGVSRLRPGWNGLCESFTEAKEALVEAFYHRERVNLQFSDGVLRSGAVLEMPQRLYDELREAFEALDGERVEQCIGKAFTEVRKAKGNLESMSDGLIQIFFIGNRTFREMTGRVPEAFRSKDEWNEAWTYCMDVGELERVVRERCLSAVNDIQEQEKTQGNLIVQRVKQFIKEHYQTTLELNDLADHVYLSPNYLSKRFKDETGLTITQYIMQVRIQQAKTILKNHFELKTYEVGDRVGYSDSAYFNRIFKKEVGLTPQEYKKVASQNQHMK